MESNRHSPPCVLDTGEPSLRSPCRYDGCVSNAPSPALSQGERLLIVARSQVTALAVIHKSVRVEIFREWDTGNTIVTGKRSLTQSSQRRKEERFSLRLCVKLALWNCRIFMCTDKYHYTCVYDESSYLGMGFLKLQLPAERPSRSLQDQGSQAGAWEPAKKPSRSWRPRPNRPHTVETDSV